MESEDTRTSRTAETNGAGPDASASGAGRGASRSGPSDASGDGELARHNSSASIQDLDLKRRSKVLVTDAKRGSSVIEESPFEGGVSESDPNCQRISHKLTQQVVEEEREEDHNSDVAVLTPNQPFRPRATVVRERTPTDRSTTAIEEDVRLNEKLPYPVQASDSNHLLEERVPPIGYGIDTKKSLDFLLDATSAVYKDFLVRGVNGSEKILRESMPFLCNGYKLRVQVKIDEDVSLSIVIMKGERDRNLPWPFDYQVLFRLINQRGNYDIRKMFRSDTNGARFKDALQKPKSESNLPLGFPKFAKRCNLLEQGFVRENVMQMECYVFKKASKLNLKPEMPSIIK